MQLSDYRAIDVSIRRDVKNTTTLRAIIVTEHRGLSLDARDWSRQAEGIIMIMVWTCLIDF